MTTATETARLVGADVDRVDGPSKVTGAARYPADFGLENLAHAVLVQSTVAAGRIRRIATARAEAAPGVLTVITHRNAPRLARAPGGLGIGPPAPLQDDRVVHHGQHIAVVVAQTLEQAAAAARLVEADYETAEPLLDLDDPRAERVDNAAGRDVSRGDVAAGLAAAEVIVAATYTTPVQTNNPLGLFATIASWDGDLLTVHDSTQGPAFARTALAVAFGLPETAVRVLAPFVGGAFGAGLRTWPHVVLAALAARVAGRLWVPRTSSTSCDQAVFVDHATDTGLFSDSVLLKIDRFGERFQRRSRVQRPVGPVLIVMGLVLTQDPPQMVLIPDEGPVEELAPASADPAFGYCVHARRPAVTEHGPDSGIGEDGVECGSEVRAAVADHELDPLRLLAEVHQQVPGLLRGPLPGGMQSDPEDADAPAGVLDHGQDISLGAVEQVGGEEVAR